ncbi:MAG: hypothetical protein ACYT04_43110 [Nostoc sp.]
MTLLGAIAEIIESSKNIENPTVIGYWIDIMENALNAPEQLESED